MKCVVCMIGEDIDIYVRAGSGGFLKDREISALEKANK